MAQQTGEVETENDSKTNTDDLDAETEAFLSAAEELKTDCGGWDAIRQMGAIVACWVDDSDDPVFGVGVLSTGKSVPLEGKDEIQTREGVLGGSYTCGHRTVSGYELSIGPTRTDGGTSITIDEWYGDPEQTPREAELDIYLDVLRKARMWLQFHSPRQMRVAACLNGNGPSILPEQIEDADDGQGTLGQYGKGHGI